MEEMTLGTILAVFEEIFGKGLFWAMVVVARGVTVGYVYVLIRDREDVDAQVLLAQLSMPIGGIAAVWFVLWVTRSGLQHMGGPIDALVAAGDFRRRRGRFAILVYVAQSLVRGKKSRGS